MREFNIVKLIVFTGIYFFFSVAMVFVTNTGLSLWMGINVGFAVIPLLLIVFLRSWFLERKMKFDFVFVLVFIIFILFYPNSFYILTDFIHLDQNDFYNILPEAGLYGSFQTTYVTNIQPYFILFHIIVSAIIGTFVGIQSLLYLRDILNQKYNNNVLNHFVIIIMLFLSSLGIYLGRFLRFFSFDILRPLYLLKTFFSSIEPFTFSFVFFFTILELFIFYSYYYFMHQKSL